MYSYRVLFVYFLTIICVSTEEEDSSPMSKEERISLREEARKMFYHAYDAYMDNAFPADELMPLSCKGRWRGVTPSRGDLDDVLGNYSLTLVDSLDTLVLLGDFHEFNRAIRYVINHVRFDTDVVVSVFETNIRMLGGLLSAHVLTTELRDSVPALSWYDNELLAMAEDLGRRLLPAFNTTTGIPHGRINLHHGMHGLSHNRETCTACAGTIILEFAALSRLTGNPIYELKAARAMDRLWNTRHRTTELMGTTIDVHSGDWVRKDSGVGAGIDSYYEYCLKAYILLGDAKYLRRFNRHYNAIKKYISRGPLMLAVYMHRPHLQSRNFMDALLAFWPGVQVMMGDLRPAVEIHEMLYQVMQRHTFIPEAFTSDFQVHWGQHPLRPEFLESTYFLHRATGDPYYLRVGRYILRALQQYARVSCGYAAVNDVRTRAHEDRMDSFVLAETFKYLFMLFSKDEDLPVNLQRYIMTTEAHFLPLSLGHGSRNSSARIVVLDDDDEDKTKKTCPSSSSAELSKYRAPMRQLVGASAARPAARLRPLGDPRQLHALADMGISVLTLADGRVQLLYTTSTARSPNDAAEGLTFMREMSRWNSLSDADNGVQLIGIKFNDVVYTAGPAHFGKEITGETSYEGTVALVQPQDACSEITNKEEVAGKMGIAYRGKCTFTQKVRYMQLANIRLAIIIDNTPHTSADTSAVFAMSNDGKDTVDVVIPSAFLYTVEGRALTDALQNDPELTILIAEKGRFQNMQNCPEGKCLEGNIDIAAERESFDRLKAVLTQLVAQFERSLNAEDIPKKNNAKHSYPEMVYSKERFVCDKNRNENPGEEDDEESSSDTETHKTEKSNFSSFSNDESSDKENDIDEKDVDETKTACKGENTGNFPTETTPMASADGSSMDTKNNKYVAPAADTTETDSDSDTDSDDHTDDKDLFRGVVEYTIEPEVDIEVYIEKSIHIRRNMGTDTSGRMIISRSERAVNYYPIIRDRQLAPGRTRAEARAVIEGAVRDIRSGYAVLRLIGSTITLVPVDRDAMRLTRPAPLIADVKNELDREEHPHFSGEFSGSHYNEGEDYIRYGLSDDSSDDD
ncbi:ER degradation-enhancing alpha-mannosidase-like protein 3 isoform X2 [Epargyreus clarus]|uniref:ER degradation-enhancing alpha-mannosidase-like protein 3 isoform X2 n=1 Tax=Epargyreus clarus TaxID=520877 RepID=UPI003C2B2634